MSEFKLSEAFIEKYKGKQPEWGPLGLITFKKNYAWLIQEENRTEEFWEACKRIVEGTYGIQKKYCEGLKLPWNGVKAQHSAQTMFRLMWEMKFLPPGRGMKMMGTEAIKTKLAAPLYNCSFTSTADILTNRSEPFCFLMDMSMLGVGVGFDTKGAETISIKTPRQGNYTFVVEDTREGWVELVRTYIDAYFGYGALPSKIDYSKVRPYGAPVKTFGGTSSGCEPLKQLVETDIPEILDPMAEDLITSEVIVDLFNSIARCVVSGNIRRSATIALGDYQDKTFLSLKDPAKASHKDRIDKWRWSSNNSIFADIGMDYSEVSKSTAINGEPGYFWLETARTYGRLADPEHEQDRDLVGINPCQPGWATLLTPSGISTFDKIKVGDLIWSGQQFTKVTNKQYTGEKKVFKYITTAGSFIGTENHRIVSEEKKIEVQNAETIDICPSPMVLKISYDDENLQYIVDGLVLGDGGVHKASGDLVGLYIGEKDQDYFKHSISKFIGRHRPGISEEFYEIETNITSQELPYTFLREIPDRYFYAKPKLQQLFLKGLYSANGSICGNRITLKSSSLKLVESVQIMLSSLGIRSYYTTNKPTKVKFKNGQYLCKQSYDLNISTDRKIFAETIGFLQEYKQKILHIICENIGTSKYAHQSSKKTYQIKDIEYLGTEQVYDITVEADEHTYWTGGLLVSNCGEIGLSSEEFCNVPESFPARHETLEEYLLTLKFTYLYAKTVTLIPTHNPKTNAVQLRNRKIGLSMSGIAQSFQKHGIREHYRWCDEGYKYLKELDKIYSDWLCVPRSKKITAVKPSGSISLLPGATPGVHFPYAEYYWRTIRMDKGSQLVKALTKAGYRVENVEGHNTVAVYFPVKEKNFYRSRSDISLWEQLEIVAQMQHWWADNQVSATITFKPEEADQIQEALELYETRLKSISFLPLIDHGYEHAPYQPMAQEEYDKAIKKLKKVKLSNIAETAVYEHSYCDSDRCELPPKNG